MANVDIATLTAKLVLNTKGFSEGIDSATKDISKITSGNAWSEAGKSLNTLGKAATVAGGAIVTGSGLAVKAAVDFEDAFAGVKKTVNVTGTQDEIDSFFSHLENGIREMSTRLPVTATEIAGVTEAAGQLGIQNENLLGFTETMIGLGSATNITAQDAAVSLAQFANVTQMSQGDFDKLGSSIVELGNNMATDEASIVNMATEMAVLAQTCGFSEADILGISGAMSSMGLDAAASGTAMQRFTQDIVQAVNNGGPFLEVFADTAGMSAEEFAQAWGEDATSAFMKFIEGLGGKTTAEQLQIFDTLDIKQMREIDMLQRLAGNTELVNSAIEMSNNAWTENSALTEEVAKRNETTASQLQMVRNMLTDIAVEAGQALLPVVRELLEQARPLLQTVSEYLAAHPDTVQRIADVGAKLLVFGTAVSGIVSVVTAIGSFITTIKTLGTAISVITGGGAVAGGAVAAGGAAAGGGVLATLIGGLGAIMPVLAAVAAAVGVFALAWHNNWFGIQEKFGAVKDWIVNKFGELKAAFAEGGFTEVFQLIGEQITTWWEGTALPWLENAKASIATWFGNVGNTVKEKMTGIWGTVKEKTANIWDTVKEKTSSIWDTVKEKGSDVWDTIKEKTSGITDTVKEKGEGIFSAVKEKATSIYSSVKENMSLIKEVVANKDTWQSAETILKQTFSAIKDILDLAVDHFGEAFKLIESTVSDSSGNVSFEMAALASSFASSAQSIINDCASIASAADEAIDKLSQLESAQKGAGSGGGGGFGGGHAAGGYVSAGTTYLVGELGPELITPTRSGYVHTAEETAGMLGSGQSIVINIQGDVYDDERSMRKKLKDAMLSVLQEQMAYG